MVSSVNDCQRRISVDHFDPPDRRFEATHDAPSAMQTE
jgi:hypothetical protein